MPERMAVLRDYYDNTDLTAEIEGAELDTDIVQSPMVGITVRLPSETLQQVRELAAQENIKTTALIRRWIEANLEPRCCSTIVIHGCPGENSRAAIDARFYGVTA
jgi:hypothetical protein